MTRRFFEWLERKRNSKAREFGQKRIGQKSDDLMEMGPRRHCDGGQSAAWRPPPFAGKGCGGKKGTQPYRYIKPPEFFGSTNYAAL
jgi:hypothetical protein